MELPGLAGAGLILPVPGGRCWDAVPERYKKIKINKREERKKERNKIKRKTIKKGIKHNKKRKTTKKGEKQKRRKEKKDS